MAETIQNNVQEFRVNRNVTQEQLAHAVGVTRQTIIAIEKGSYVPSVLLALKLAGFFKQHVDKIFYIAYEK